jgi:hypothetical protein
MMKKMILSVLLAMLVPCGIRAQTPEVTQLVLNIEKLNQLRKILAELKKGYEILMKGYTTIHDLSKGNFQLHEAFLNGLLEVSPAVKNYQRIKDIVDCQLLLIAEYRQAIRHLSSLNAFSSQELEYLDQVYSSLLSGSAQNLDALTSVLTAKKLRASDEERLLLIDHIYQDMADKLVFLRHFNSNNSLLAAQRNQEKASIATMQTILDVTP